MHHTLPNEDPLVRQQSKVWLLLVLHSFPLPYVRVAATTYWKTTLFGGRIFFFFLNILFVQYCIQILSLPGSSLDPLLAVVLKSVWTFINLNSCKCSPGFVTTRQPQPQKTQDLWTFVCLSADSLGALQVLACWHLQGSHDPWCSAGQEGLDRENCKALSLQVLHICTTNVQHLLSHGECLFL